MYGSDENAIFIQIIWSASSNLIHIASSLLYSNTDSNSEQY
jgi:hypothetical protein